MILENGFFGGMATIKSLHSFCAFVIAEFNQKSLDSMSRL